MTKKLLSLILCVSLALSAISIAAAEEDGTDIDTSVSVENSTGDDTAVSEGIQATVSFTNVAPFLAPVEGTAKAAVFARARAMYLNDDESETENTGLELNKTATANDDGSYTITMEAWATGEKIITEQKTDVPTDIILVLDQSGSMANAMSTVKEYSEYTGYNNSQLYSYRFNGWNQNLYYLVEGEYVEVKVDAEWQLNTRTTTYSYYYQVNNQTFPIETSTGSNTVPEKIYYKAETITITRLDALKTAVNSFINSVSEKAAGEDDVLGTDDDVNHRIAIVGFASESGYGNNTELLSISGTNSGNVGVMYGSITDENYSKVFQSMNTSDGQTMVNKAVNALAAEGATQTDLGLLMAKNILEKNPLSEGEKRNRVVIVFTDGSPTSFNGFESNVAEMAIQYATIIKNTGATVYSVGIFSGADASTSGTKPSQDLSDNSSDLSAASNWFMQNVSSNNGTPQNPSYYLSAANAKDLSNIFQQISDQIESGGSNSTLGSETVIKDIVTPYFTMPSNASDITIQTAKYTAENTWEIPKALENVTVSIDQDTSTVSVSGFDFSENWVGTETVNGNTEYRGQKLIISFKVNVAENFLGGNQVVTNGSNSGVYVDDDLIEPFNVPTVDVPIKTITPHTRNMNIYLSNTADLNILFNVADDFNGLGVGNSYVNIQYQIKNAEDEVIATYMIPAGEESGTWENSISNIDLNNDAEYSVICTVMPILQGKYENQMADNKAQINVYKPVITWQDSQIVFGDTADFAADNFVSTIWKHNDTTSNSVTMTGTAPVLTFAYNPDAGAFTEDTPVSVAVSIGNKDITEHVKFEHSLCDFDGCEWEELTTKPQFIVHIRTFDLTIQKVGWDKLDPDQTFLFTVKSEKAKIDMKVVIKENGQITIKNLPIADDYQIVEVGSWSWRYLIKAMTEFNVNAIQNGKLTIQVTNERSKIQWLDGNAYSRNYFDGNTTVTSNYSD